MCSPHPPGPGLPFQSLSGASDPQQPQLLISCGPTWTVSNSLVGPQADPKLQSTAAAGMPPRVPCRVCSPLSSSKRPLLRLTRDTRQTAPSSQELVSSVSRDPQSWPDDLT